MGEFFSNRRRRRGAFLLLVSAVLTAAWLRSFVFYTDVIRLDASHQLYSHNGFISWNYTTADTFPSDITMVTQFQENALGFAPVSYQVLVPKLLWRRELFGFVASEISFQGIRTTQYWVPYWFLTLPPLLASGWMLLRKPKASEVSPNAQTKIGDSDL